MSFINNRAESIRLRIVESCSDLAQQLLSKLQSHTYERIHESAVTNFLRILNLRIPSNYGIQEVQL